MGPEAGRHFGARPFFFGNPLLTILTGLCMILGTQRAGFQERPGLSYVSVACRLLLWR